MKGETSGLAIRGPLTLDTVAAHLRTIRASVREADALALDLSAAGPLDSSALALILAAIRSARARGKVFRLTGSPVQLGELASLYELDELIGAAAL